MTSAEWGLLRRSGPVRRNWVLVMLVALMACGVIAMHALGAGHLGAGAALGHGLGPAMSAGPSEAGRAPRASPAAHEVGPRPAPSVTYDAPGGQHGVESAALLPGQTGAHGGLSMCLAVLSLLAWVVLHRRCRSFRMMGTLTRAGQQAFTGLVRGPPRRHAPLLSELCICRR